MTTKRKQDINRLADAENTLESCAIALRLIPIRALRKSMTWMPSDEAIDLISDAKDELDKYARKHSLNGRD